ncbi:MAG: TonB-dependent receptor [Ignavibacteriae bacterium]|nr:TonB-dependent receptor [Ignavibacteriota bacterium]
MTTSIIGFAQQLHGYVFGIDAEGKKAPLVSATVQWLGTSTGVLSNKEGEFKIKKTDESSKLVISYTGYNKDTINIAKDQKHVEIELKSNLTTEEVKVYGENPGTLISKSDIVNTQQITLSGLRKAACCNLSESFSTNASVDVEYSDAVSGAKQIQMLGLAGIYSQLLTEKVPSMRGIAQPFGMVYIPGPWMQSIQISKGAASVITGYESITGQINVEYKKAQESEPFFASLFGDYFGRFEADMNTRYKFSDKTSTALFFHGNLQKMEIDGNKDSFLDQPLLSQVNLMNRWWYHDGDLEMQLVGKVIYEDRKGGQKGFFPLQDSSLYGMDMTNRRYEIWGKIGYIFPTVSYNSLAVIYSLNSHSVNSYFGRRNYDGKQNSAYINLMYDVALSDMFGFSGNEDLPDTKPIEHKLSLGFSYQYDDINETFAAIPLNRIESVPGMFAEYTLQNLWGFTLSGGVRQDFHNLFGNFFTPRVHLKYEISPTAVIRASAGKGYRIPNIYAENVGAMASSRQFILEESIKPEIAWNYGLNTSFDFTAGGTYFTFNMELYRTDFENQLIADMDQDVRSIHFYNLKGKSFSNSFQVDLTFKPFDKLDIVTAYRYNDVQMTINDKLDDKPMVSKHKYFINTAYTIGEGSWLIDATAVYNGKMRLPHTKMNPVEYRIAHESSPFLMLNAQITKKIDNLSIFLGAENLTDYKQTNPIIAANDPFGRLTGTSYFDSSIIWAPIIGRVIYIGVRYEIR